MEPPPGNASRAAAANDSSAAAGPGPGAGTGAGAALLALSALGNGAVVLAIARHPQLRTVPNACVLSLSLSALLGALLAGPLALVPRPRCGLCAAGAALHAGLGGAAALTTALLAFERYRALARPPRRPLGRRRAAQLLAAAWLLALALAAPGYALAALGHGPGPGPRCLLLPPSWRLYRAALIVPCYLLPFALMCFCHYGIRRAVRLAAARTQPLPSPFPRPSPETRTATTVLLVIVAAIGCWAPYCVLGLAGATGRPPRSPAWDAAAGWLAWANGAINPLIYAARNPQLALLLGRRRRQGGGGYRGGRHAAAYLAGRGGRPPAAAAPGQAATWACKNPALLFCRDGRLDTPSDTAPPAKAGAADTSL
ncbi:G-protein coupled receptor 135 [Alligator mississippiensis]|uniref:G-protein coupled receptor 135 n=1 Tax=Alligator mississippiensis TaxID=8496 RepID=UPI0028772FCC|nr:G-protein coupled receptor 135 [Alligator mississippiensis]